MKKVLACVPTSFLLSGVFFMAGCAFSPQEVRLAPRVTIEQSVLTESRSINTLAYDQRPSTSVGYRGGVYGNTNVITTGVDLPSALQSAVREALGHLGFTMDASKATPTFQVYLEELSYKVPEGNYVTKVDLSARIKVIVSSDSQRFEGDYGTTRSERVLSTPSDEQNEELINKVVSDALNRAFDDKKLLQFLARL